MAGHKPRTVARMMMTPSVVLLMLWMIVPLGMTLYFSFLRYNLLRPPASFWGWKNYSYFLTDTAFLPAVINTLLLVLGVVVISVIGGILLAIVLNKDIWGRGIVRLMVIAPFFIMPTVSALVWKNMFMNPVNGLFGYAAQWLGVTPIDFLAHYPLESIIGIVAWQWLPFATLILLTALQSLDQEQMEAAEMDGAGTYIAVYPYHLAPFGTPHYRCRTDTNDFFIKHICRDFCDDFGRTWHGKHQSALADIPHGAVKQRYRRGGGGRSLGNHSGEYSRRIFNAPYWQKSGCIGGYYGTRTNKYEQNNLDYRGMGDWLYPVFPDILDDINQL